MIGAGYWDRRPIRISHCRSQYTPPDRQLEDRDRITPGRARITPIPSVFVLGCSLSVKCFLARPCGTSLFSRDFASRLDLRAIAEKIFGSAYDTVRGKI